MLFKLSPFAGLNRDLSAVELLAGALTDSVNVRFRKGMAELFPTKSTAYGAAPLAPVTVFPVHVGTTRYWLVLGTAKAYCVTGAPAVWTNITRQTAVTYAEEPAVPKFQAEGQALRAWRSLVWAACYEHLALVEAGEAAIPTLEDAIAMLPVFTPPEAE